MTPELIVYETTPLDWWGGMVPLSKFKAAMFADDYADEIMAPGCTPSGFQEYIDGLLAEARALAEAVLLYEGDIRQGPFLGGLPDPDYNRTLPILAWKQDNNGTTYIATLTPLPHLEGNPSAGYRNGKPYKRSHG